MQTHSANAPMEIGATTMSTSMTSFSARSTSSIALLGKSLTVITDKKVTKKKEINV